MENSITVLDNELNDAELDTISGGAKEVKCQVEIDDKGNKKLVCSFSWTW
jgi:bacteriocin-like protein